MSSAFQKKMSVHYGCVCTQCDRIMGQEYNGETLEVGCPPVRKGSRYATCQPCRDAPVCEGGCGRREIPDGIKLVESNHGLMCRDCIDLFQKIELDVREAT